MEKPLIMLLAITGSALCLSCYSFNSHNSQGGSVIENKTYCSAYYDVSTGSVTFGGSDGDPKKVDAFGWEMSKNQDCQIRNSNDNSNGTEVHRSLYVCICFQNLCNYPFSWEEFKNRNYTLAAHFPEFEDIEFPED